MTRKETLDGLDMLSKVLHGQMGDAIDRGEPFRIVKDIYLEMKSINIQIDVLAGKTEKKLLTDYNMS